MWNSAGSASFGCARILGFLAVALIHPIVLSAQSSAPTFRWEVVDTSTFVGKLKRTVSFAPASIKVIGNKVHVWMLTDEYRAEDDYRQKYYGEFEIDCGKGYATEVSAVLDRFGRGKPARYGTRRSGMNDYPDIFDVNARREAAVLRSVARKSCRIK